MSWEIITLGVYSGTMTICWIISYCLLHERSEQIHILEANVKYLKDKRDDAMRTRNAFEISILCKSKQRSAAAAEMMESLDIAHSASCELRNLLKS